MLHWIAMWNGFVVGEDGRTPYHRRFSEHAPYRQYPFGALVLLHPHRPVQPLRSEPVHEKLHSRLVPSILVEVTIGPAGRWGDCYGVVPVVYFTSNLRASRVCIRRSCDIVFPEHGSFPLKARLALHGALEDKTLPVPHALDDGGSWEVMEDTSQFDEVAVFEDGQCGDNAASFEKETDVGYVLALESDGDGTDGQDIDIAAEEGAEGFPAVDADLIEQQVRRDALMQEVVLVQGGRAPDGWRIDRFPRADGTVRLVPTPPWSRRVPNMEPEDWIATNKRVQNVLREDWKSEDPENFNAQERRRAAWLRGKAERRGIPPVAMAIATPLKKRTRGKGVRQAPPIGTSGAEEYVPTRPAGRWRETHSHFAENAKYWTEK